MLLDLLRELVLSLPKFRIILVCSPIEGGDTFLLDILFKIILEHMQPNKTHIHRDTLAKEILSLLDSLCFSASTEAIEKWVTKTCIAYFILFPQIRIDTSKSRGSDDPYAYISASLAFRPII